MSWVRQWWEFCGGSLILIGTKMREKAEILNVTLAELGAPDIPYHVVAIKRGTETIIPRGDDTIKLHDIVYFTTTRKYIPYIRKNCRKGRICRRTQCDDYGRQPHRSPYSTICTGLHAGKNCG